MTPRAIVSSSIDPRPPRPTREPQDLAAHALQAIHQAMRDLQAVLATTEDISTLLHLREEVSAAWLVVDALTLAILDKADTILERQR